MLIVTKENYYDSIAPSLVHACPLLPPLSPDIGLYGRNDHWSGSHVTIGNFTTIYGRRRQYCIVPKTLCVIHGIGDRAQKKKNKKKNQDKNQSDLNNTF